MTIIQVMHSHGVGGVERHVVTLSNALTQRGHRVFLACPNRSWLWDAVRDTPVTPVHVAMNGLLDVTSVYRLTRLARHTHADVIHSHMTRGAYYAVKTGRRMGAPVVATAHATHTFKHYGGAGRVLCVADAVRRNLLHHGVPADKMRVVYNGVSIPAVIPDSCAALREDWEVPAGGCVVGMLSRLIPDKGVDLLLDLAERWTTARPNVRFVIAGGGDAETEKALKDRVNSGALRDTVRFLGPVANTWEVLRAFDVLAAPSRREAFSLTLLEAMAAGTPVVATDVGGTREMVENGETGYLIPPEDSNRLESALVEALDGNRRAGIIAAAKAKVESRFSVEHMVDEIEAEYLEVRRIGNGGLGIEE